MRLRSLPRSAGEARDALAMFAEVLPAEAYTDLRVIVTELVTNSVKYGPGRTISVSVGLDTAGLITGDVADGGAGGVRMRRCSDPVAGGLGLQIVDALATSWGVYPDSAQVWFELATAA